MMIAAILTAAGTAGCGVVADGIGGALAGETPPKPGEKGGPAAAAGPRAPDARLTEDPCGFLDARPLAPVIGPVTLWAQQKVFELENGVRMMACTGESGDRGYLLVQYTRSTEVKHAVEHMKLERRIMKPGTSAIGAEITVSSPLGGDSVMEVVRYGADTEDHSCNAVARQGAVTVEVLLSQARTACAEPATTVLREAMKHV